MCSVSQITDTALASAMADLMVANVSADYISHSEMMFGRAKNETEWMPNLARLLAGEFADYLTSAKETRIVMGAFAGSELIGFAILFLDDSTNAGVFSVLEDIVVAEEHRQNGIMRKLLNACDSAARDAGATRMFMESGKNNRSAHAAFQAVGFNKVSEVFCRDL